jgi:Fe-S-cluster containining protein
MTLPLSRPYPCRFGAPVLDRVDPRIFRLTYFKECMACTSCHDGCCQWGVDVELPRVAAIERHRAELEAYLGVPRSRWFREDPDDFGVLDEPQYPGGKYTRTQVVDAPGGRSYPSGTVCVFLDHSDRGCRLHRFALERGIDPHEIKPMMCLLFPASFENGELLPPVEFEEEDGLACRGPGGTIYQGSRADLLYYFGAELVAELDALERAELAGANPGGPIPLPLCSSS